MRKAQPLILALILLSCGGQDASTPTLTTVPGSDTTAGTTTSTTAPPTTSPTTTSTTVPIARCETAFGEIAWIEATAEPSCMNVAAHQQLVIRNATERDIELIWKGDAVTIASEDVFVPEFSMGDNFDLGAQLLDSADVSVTIVLMAPQTSLFINEPMFLRRWGPVNVGDSVEDAERKLGSRLVFPDAEFFPDGACMYGYVEGDPYSPGFMVLDRSRIVRMDATAFEHRTASGIKYGSTAEEVVEAYGDLIERSPHAYVDGEYLTLVPRDDADKDYRLVFETIRDEFQFVNGFRNGLEGPVSWIEGCL